MSQKRSEKNIKHERRLFLRSSGVGTLAFILAGISGGKSEASEVRYNKANLIAVNKKLINSSAERQAFFKDPHGYLKRHNITVTDDMIPSRQQLETAVRNPQQAQAAMAYVVVATGSIAIARTTINDKIPSQDKVERKK